MRRSLRCLVAFTSVALLAACAAPTDEDVGETESAVETAETVTTPTGTVPRTLKVITAAAQCPISTDCSRAWTDRFVDSIFRQHDPDIVIMTEMFWNGTYRNTVDQVGRVRPGVYNFYRGPREGVIDASGGTVIASKYVMSRKAEHEFTNRIKPDSYVDKGFAGARQRVGVLADGQVVEIDVGATHFQSKTLGIFGNFTNVQSSQITETSRFVSGTGVWGPATEPSTTLKIYSGDLNYSGAGPTWLGADKVTAGKANFAKLRDTVLLPYGFRDATDVCEGAMVASRATGCSSRTFVEKEPHEVMKQFHVPFAKLPTNPATMKKGEPTERGLYMIPQSQDVFASGSDHEAKQITYALYVVTKRLDTGTTSTVRRKDRAPAPHEEGGGPAPHEEE